MDPNIKRLKAIAVGLGRSNIRISLSAKDHGLIDKLLETARQDENGTWYCNAADFCNAVDLLASGQANAELEREAEPEDGEDITEGPIHGEDGETFDPDANFRDFVEDSGFLQALGLPDRLVEILEENGIRTPSDIPRTLEELQKLKGIGPGYAKRILGSLG